MLVANVFPNRLSVTMPKVQKSVHSRWADKLCRSSSKVHKNSIRNLSVKKSSWALSDQSKRKFIDSCGFLLECSKPRSVRFGKKLIYNYRASFITLTLPTKQTHSDLEIKKCLNQFLTQLRATFNLSNYIWKAELQANGNIHFHLIIDLPIHHSAIRYYWNQSIETLGYVSAYRNTFSSLALAEYAQIRNLPVSQCVSAYQKGISTNWSSPPTEQVISVHSNGQLSHYLTKYITKPLSNENCNLSESELERVQNFGRTWARSQSLSSIIFQFRYDWNSLKDFLSVELDSLKKVIHDYCTVYYLSKSSSSKIKNWFHSRMINLGITYLYPFPVPI
jgi:hypothetical protein